jgi:hypothetical protein
LEEQASEALFFLRLCTRAVEERSSFWECISATARVDYISDCFDYASDRFDYASNCFDYIFDYFNYISDYYDYFLVASANALRSPASNRLLIGYIKQAQLAISSNGVSDTFGTGPASGTLFIFIVFVESTICHAPISITIYLMFRIKIKL